MTISRRDLLKGTAAALALPALPQLPVPNSQPRFFTAAEFAVVDEMSDMIIPTDAQSGGARAAGVAAYIDARLAESFEKEPPARWRAGLQAVEALSREMSGKTFMASSPEQRLAVLTRMAAGEGESRTPAQRFFGEIKGFTVRAYYTSKIGIHDDQQYKGNVYQTGEFAGFDPA
ncbi:MAG TPA: gluconate 2-dehydrogenase subunit 3 family protein [Gemmatimonadales bacterium]|nr:gluconate 2-dehydrogenase subunit 3 family protein [Gemmatimonadales bacterium]